MTDEPAQPTAEWLAMDLATRENPTCHHLQRELLPHNPVHLRHLGNSRSRFSFVDRVALGLIHQEFREIMEPDFSQRFSRVSVLVNDTLLPEWTAFVEQNPVRVRGGKQSFCHRCPICHRIIYTHRGTWTILRSDIPESRIFGLHFGGICVDEEIAGRLLSRKWPLVAIRTLRVVERPMDGFPSDLNQLQPSEERRWEAP
jgi:hypothetical protein